MHVRNHLLLRNRTTTVPKNDVVLFSKMFPITSSFYDFFIIIVLLKLCSMKSRTIPSKKTLLRDQ